MGMYTELVFGGELKSDTPENVINILKYLIDDETIETFKLPDHPFFECDRWTHIAISSSYYFGGQCLSGIKYDGIANAYRISIRANLKNYDNEIDKFVDWIKPYMDKGAGANNLLGYSIYEESSVPTLYYLQENQDEG
jgi:hypothetical protein